MAKNSEFGAFAHETTLRTDRFAHLFREDKATSEATWSSAGEFIVFKANHAAFGRVVGIQGVLDNPLVFSEHKIPAGYPSKRNSAAPDKAA